MEELIQVSLAERQCVCETSHGGKLNLQYVARINSVYVCEPAANMSHCEYINIRFLYNTRWQIFYLIFIDLMFKTDKDGYTNHSTVVLTLITSIIIHYKKLLYLQFSNCFNFFFFLKW